VSRLIINADDFGLTGGVNRAVAELHGAGIVTSTTLMARAGACDEAIRISRGLPALGVGCHVVLVDGEPVLPWQEIPSLVDRGTGRFHATLSAFLVRLLSGRINAAEIQAEAAAQTRLLQLQGIPLTHIDTHKHTHLFAEVLRPVLRAAWAAGIVAVRNPFEPAWSRRATPNAWWLRRTQVTLLHGLEPAFRRIVAEEGFVTTDGALGVLATGTLDTATLHALLAKLPEGTWEMVTHPGYDDGDLARAHTRLLASRDREREALAALRLESGIELIDFSAV